MPLLSVGEFPVYSGRVERHPGGEAVDHDHQGRTV
jgi:hypothetical protein